MISTHELFDAETGERLAVVPVGARGDRLSCELADRLAATGKLVAIRSGIHLLWLHTSEKSGYGWDECHWWGPHIGVTHRLLPEFGGTDENGLLYPAWAKANPTLTPMSPERADFLIPFQRRGRLGPAPGPAWEAAESERRTRDVMASAVPVELVEAVTK